MTARLSLLVRTTLLGLLVTLGGCASKPPPGIVLSPADKAGHVVADVPTLVDHLESADFIVLGELHDNAEHHALQEEVLRELHKRGWLQQIAMEMLQPYQQAGADNVVSERITNMKQLNSQLQWQKGWDWELYGPIVSWAAGAGIALVAANIDPGERKMLEEYPARLSHKLLGKEGQKIHLQKLREAHCQMLDEAMVERMLRVQIARDVRMANRLSTSKGTVLLAGNWHARKDIGVPHFLELIRPGSNVMVLGALEMSDLSLAQPSIYDIVWVTEALDRTDPCAAAKPVAGELSQSS